MGQGKLGSKVRRTTQPHDPARNSRGEGASGDEFMRMAVRICVAALACVSVLASGSSLLWAKGKKPIALIESIIDAPASPFQAFDYVYNKNKIDLRPSGTVILSYFDTCVVETFTGGIVKIKKDGGHADKGGTSTQQVRPCRTARLALSKAAKEAGVSVKRVSPYDVEEWREWALNTDQPIFKWVYDKKIKGPAQLTIYYLEADPIQPVWQAQTEASHLTYPATAPALIPGMPYQAVVTFAKGKPAKAVFSVDPGLELPETPANRLVPLD